MVELRVHIPKRTPGRSAFEVKSCVLLRPNFCAGHNNCLRGLLPVALCDDCVERPTLTPRRSLFSGRAVENTGGIPIPKALAAFAPAYVQLALMESCMADYCVDGAVPASLERKFWVSYSR